MSLANSYGAVRHNSQIALERGAGDGTAMLVDQQNGGLDARRFSTRFGDGWVGR